MKAIIIGVDIFKWARMITLKIVEFILILFFTISILTLKIVLTIFNTVSNDTSGIGFN